MNYISFIMNDIDTFSINGAAEESLKCRAGSGHFFSGPGRVRAAHIEPGSGLGH